MKRYFLLGTMTMLAVIVSAVFCTAGYIVKESTTSEAVTPMGPQTNTDVSTIYIEKGKIKSFSETDSTTMIVRLDKQIMYDIDHSDKTYQEIPFAVLESMSKNIGDASSPEMQEAMKGMSPEQKAMMEKMMGEMFAPMNVERTSETKSLIGHKCQKYVISRSGKSIMEIWAAEDLEVGRDFTEYLKITSAGHSEMFAEFDKIKGMPLETTVSMEMGGVKTKSHNVVTEVNQSSIGDSEFEVPAGYKKVAFEPPQEER